MRRVYKYPNEPVSISFKTAIMIVIGIHLFGGLLYVGSTKTTSNIKTKQVVKDSANSVGPISDALDCNWPRKTKPNKVSTQVAQVQKQKEKRAELLVSNQQIKPIPTEYVLSPGDNFYTVSRKLGVSFQELAKYNNVVDVRSLRVGQVIKVPQKG